MKIYVVLVNVLRGCLFTTLPQHIHLRHTETTIKKQVLSVNNSYECFKEICKCRGAFDRSNPPEVFLKEGVLKLCSKFTGEHPCRSVI